MRSRIGVSIGSLCLWLGSHLVSAQGTQYWAGDSLLYNYDTNYVKEPPVNLNLKKTHPGYDIGYAIPDARKLRFGGMDFLPDGRMVVADWQSFNLDKGNIYILDSLEKGENAVTFTKVASEIWEPLGLVVADGEIFFLAQDGIWKLEKNTVGNGYTKKPFLAMPVPLKNGGVFPLAYDLQYHNGSFYFTTGGYGNTHGAQGEGYVFRVSKSNPKDFEVISKGLRNPNGLGVNAAGAMFVTDNQGEYRRADPIYHVRRGKHYQYLSAGNVLPSTLDSIAEPAMWIPHGEAACSLTDMFYLDSGKYRGQFLVGDNRFGSVGRASLEQVNGVYQGAYFLFSGIDTAGGIYRFAKGQDGSIYWGALGDPQLRNWTWNGKITGMLRMQPNYKRTFDLQNVRAIKGGFVVDFTEPAEAAAALTKTYLVHSWTYGPTAPDYGGAKLDFKPMPVASATLSADSKTVMLTITGLAVGRVYRITVDSTLKSSTGLPLWTNKSWYTLNVLGNDVVGLIKPADVPAAGVSGWAWARQGKTLEIKIMDPGAFHLQVLDTRGRILRQENGIGPVNRTLEMPESGLWWVNVATRSGNKVEKVYGF